MILRIFLSVVTEILLYNIFCYFFRFKSKIIDGSFPFPDSPKLLILIIVSFCLKNLNQPKLVEASINILGFFPKIFSL